MSHEVAGGINAFSSGQHLRETQKLRPQKPQATRPCESKSAKIF